MADPHLGRTTNSTPGTTSRAEDLGETLLRFADTAIEEKVDLAVLPGDLFHTRRPVPRDLLYLAKSLVKLRRADIFTAISGGNHDGSDTVGDESSHALAWMTALSLPGVVMFTTAKHSVVKLSNDKLLNIVATPYPHKRAFDAVLPDAAPEERVEQISRAYEKAVDAMIDDIQERNPNYPTLFMGHVSVVGAALGSEVSMRFGMDVTARSGLFDKVDYAALGHIHRQQQIGEKAWYAGSPEYMTFGEEGHPKGFLLVDFDKGRAPKVEVIDSQPRPMLTVEMHESATGWAPSVTSIPDGAMIQLLIHPQEAVSKSVLSRMVRDYRTAGASFVTHKVILPERLTTVRAQLSAESEAEESLRAWLVEGGYEVEPALTIGMELINAMGASGE